MDNAWKSNINDYVETIKHTQIHMGIHMGQYFIIFSCSFFHFSFLLIISHMCLSLLNKHAHSNVDNNNKRN